MTATERERLHKDLIKLGDMMGNGLHYEDPSISREYRKVAKLLYTDLYLSKKRKPSQAFIRTLKECNCGQKGWSFIRFAKGTVGIKCPGCSLTTDECNSNNEARDKWNELINSKSVLTDVDLREIDEAREERK